MRGNRLFFLSMGVAAVLFFLLQLQLPQRFSWEPTFDPADKNPFGSYAFDSILHRSLPHGYRVVDKTLYQLSQDTAPQSVLIISRRLRMSELDIKAMRRIMERGGRIMMVANTYTDPQDSIGLYEFGIGIMGYDGGFSLSSVRNQLRDISQQATDTIYWKSTPPYPDKGNIYECYQAVLYGRVLRDSADLKADTLSYTKETYLYMDDEPEEPDSQALGTASQAIGYEVRPARAMRQKVGKGELVMVGTPLLFTNFGMLTGNTHEYLARLLNELKDLPVVRTTHYMESEAALQARQSPFRVLLSHRPLRWALYLLLGTVVLFMGFTARRRQRVIPVMAPPRNHALEFTRLIGTLYYQQGDHTDLVRKKYSCFCEELRRQAHVDLSAPDNDGQALPQLARMTGLPLEDVKETIVQLRRVQEEDVEVSAAYMKALIDQMNQITHLLS